MTWSAVLVLKEHTWKDIIIILKIQWNFRINFNAQTGSGKGHILALGTYVSNNARHNL